MNINIEKMETILIESIQKWNPLQSEMKLSFQGHHTLLYRKTSKSLYIDNNLNWKHYIDYTFSLMSSRIALLRRSLIYLPFMSEIFFTTTLFSL